MTEYMVDSIAWSGFGLAVGYFLGKAELTIKSFFTHHHYQRGHRDHT